MFKESSVMDTIRAKEEKMAEEKLERQHKGRNRC